MRMLDADGHASPDLRWIADVLWGGLAGIRVTLGEPTGGRVLERYAIVPSARRPRLLLPFDRRAAWAAAADAPATRSPRAALERRVAGAAARSGFAPFRDRLTVLASDEADPEATVAARLATLLGAPVTLGVNVRPPGPYRKPVLSLVGPGGRVLAYAKVGWNDPTAENVEAEADVLRAAATAQAFSVPEVLGELRWRDRPVLVTRPLPRGLRRYDARAGAPAVEATREVTALFATGDPAYREGPVRARLRARAGALAGDHLDPAISSRLDALAAVLDALDARGDVRLPFGGWHGDWSPWNLARGPDRLWVWDWEYARPDAPLGLDVAHFHFQVAFVRERRGLGASLERAHAAALEPLDRLGLDAAARSLLRGLHAAELALRATEAETTGAPPNPRFAVQIVSMLRSVADRVANG
jgi:hypothetical protein